MKSELVIGRVRSSFGIAGEMKIESYSGESDHFTSLKVVRLRLGSSESFHDVEAVRVTGRAILMKLEGIESPEDVAAVRGSEIVVPREQAAPLDRGEYYCADLEELVVVCEGARVGGIESIRESGAHPLVEVSTESGERVLIPFTNEFFGEVDLDRGEIELINRMVLE